MRDRIHQNPWDIQRWRAIARRSSDDTYWNLQRFRATFTPVAWR